MATISVPPAPHRSPPRLWRFTWEALAHMPALRLFLFSDDLDPSSRYADLRASLSLEESLLLVNWSEQGAGELALRVPLPKALIDPVSAIHCVPRGDHIEVKLTLVLPLDHPMSVNLSGALLGLEQEGEFSDCTLPLSVNSDLKRLSTGDIHLYCRTCSTRLTRRPPRNFIEMPSADWRDVADNWFGTCCCSFGGASEKLVHQYVRVYNCSKSTCLLDGPSVVISKDDLDGYAFQKYPGEYAVNFNILDPVAKSEVQQSGFVDSSFNGVESLGCLPQNDSKFNDDLYVHSSNNIEAIIKTERSMNWNKSSGAFFDSSENQFSIKQIVTDKANHHSGHACGEKCNVSKVQFPVNDLDLQRSHLSSIIGSLGSGFLTKASNLSNDVEWVEFLCKQCSSFLGSYPRVNGINNPVDGGVRLFKCCISTSGDPCGPQDVFRKYTFQKVFVGSLLESAAYELSFRTIVRDLRTKSPMLQIIILNSKAWCTTGSCFENEIVRCFAKLNMRPVVKVLFSDFSESGASSSATQRWITKNNAEEVYMMSHQTEELITFLKLAHESLPPSCSSFEGMSLSYIER